MDCCRENSCMSCICEYFTTIVRVFGIMVAVAFWVMGVNVISVSFIGIYLFFIAVVLSVLEGLFLFETCITGCCREGGGCWKLWKVVSFLDNWKRAILYVALSIPCYIAKAESSTESKTTLVIIAGVILCLLALAYFCRSFFVCGNKDEEPKQKRSKKYKEMNEPANVEAGQANTVEAGQADTVSAEKVQVIQEKHVIDEDRWGGNYEHDTKKRDDDITTSGDAGVPTLEDRYPQ